MKPRLLDLFGGAQGAGVGYARAGFSVTSVDIEPHDRHPEIYAFVVADAVDYAKNHAHEFDAIHASPPCPRYSRITPAASREKHPDLVPVMRELLIATGLPWVIENVPGAPLIDPVRLCGSSFALKVRRHRLFEANFPITQPACDHKSQGVAIGVYGQHPDAKVHRRPDGTSRGLRARSLEEGRRAMGIDWMAWPDLADAIPPAYTEHIGRELMAHLEAT